MDNWKIQLVVVTFCTLLQTYQGLSPSVDKGRGLSTDWEDESVTQTQMATDKTHLIASLMKRSKALRFYGLMGKRSGVKKPFQVNKRNKGETFVGLMGRSISSGESLTRINPPATTTGIDVSEETREQGVIGSV